MQGLTPHILLGTLQASRNPSHIAFKQFSRKTLRNTGRYSIMRYNRSGENGMTPSRHDRFFQVQDYWYYSTREGVDIGPFDNVEEASVGASEFIDFISGVEPSFVQTLEQYSNRPAAA